MLCQCRCNRLVGGNSVDPARTRYLHVEAGVGLAVGSGSGGAEVFIVDAIAGPALPFCRIKDERQKACRPTHVEVHVMIRIGKQRRDVESLPGFTIIEVKSTR